MSGQKQSLTRSLLRSCRFARYLLFVCKPINDALMLMIIVKV